MQLNKTFFKTIYLHKNDLKMVYYEKWLSVEEEIKQCEELEDIRMSCDLLKDEIENDREYINKFSSDEKNDSTENNNSNKKNSNESGDD